MKSKKLFKFAIIIGLIGLIMILSVVLSKSAYPDTFFRVVTPLGLIFVFLSIVLGFFSWILMLKDAVKAKQYTWAIIVVFLGLFIIIKEVIRII